MTYTIIDVETTGKSNRITEISIFKYDGIAIIDEFTSLVNPNTLIPIHITALTGIDNQLVCDAPSFEDIAEQIEQITEGCVFVAHNVNFDYNVILGEFNRIGKSFRRKKLCTVRLSRKLLPGHPSYSLGKLCKTLNLPLVDRHRARGDAEATVKLFALLQVQQDAENVFSDFLKANSKQVTLPAHLPDALFNTIPNAPGIYYFLNQKSEILYIGKAKDLKKRVLSHFYAKKQKELDLCRETAHIDFELSGGEILALLMEDAAIKKHYPKFNVASKKRIQSYGISNYTDRKGIIHFTYNTLKLCPSPLDIFHDKRAAISCLEKICEQYALCPKYCQLQKGVDQCSHYKINTCKGICQETEGVAAYNNRVLSAIQAIKKTSPTNIIKQPGRSQYEDAFIMIKEGVYTGYGFVEKEAQVTTIEELEPYVILQNDNSDVQRILRKILT